TRQLWHGLACGTSCSPCVRLQRGEEALHRGIIRVVSHPAQATGDAVVSQKSLEGLTGILAAPIGVMQDGLRLASPPDHHYECIGASFAVIVACMDRPTTRREKRSTAAAT